MVIRVSVATRFDGDWLFFGRGVVRSGRGAGPRTHPRMRSLDIGMGGI